MANSVGSDSGDRHRVVVFLHSGEYDRLHQGLSIAAAAAASGRETLIFFFWWALDRLATNRLVADEADVARWPQRVAERVEDGHFPTAAALLESARGAGARVYACTGSLAIVGRRPDQMEGKVDGFLGWSAILDMTEGIADRFYL